MPVYVAQIVPKRTVRDAIARHDGNLVSVACHLAPLAAQPPATRAWEGQPRHLKELSTMRHASRRGPVSDQLPDATRQRPRQGACRGKPPLCARAPAHPPTCRSGTLPGVRGGRLCSQGCAVASGADKIAIVASGGVPDGPFCTV